MKKVGEFMNKRVIYFSPKNTIMEISRKFSEYGISGAPIVDSGRLVGIVTNSDIVRFVNQKLYKDATEVNSKTSSLLVNLSGSIVEGNFKKRIDDLMGTAVGDIMTRDVKHVSPDSSLEEAVSVMIDGGVNRLPVVDKGKLVGIVARNDVIRAFR